jgi:hypothetical protein
MKKVAYKVTNGNLTKFIDAVVGLNAKSVLSVSTDGFLETITLVWFYLNDEQIEAFTNAGFKPEKIV